MRKTVPEVLRKNRGLSYIDRGHNFSLYGPPGRQITFLFFLLIFTETSVGFACRIRYYLLAGKVVIFPPLMKPIRLHDSFYLARSRAQKKKKAYICYFLNLKHEQITLHL